MKSHNLYDELMEEIDNIALLTDDKSVYYCQKRLKTLIDRYLEEEIAGIRGMQR